MWIWVGREGGSGGGKTIGYLVFKNSISNIKISYIIKNLHSNQFLNSNIFFSILLFQRSLIIKKNYHQYIKLPIIKTMTLEF